MPHKHIYIACQPTYRLFPVEAKCCNLLSLTHDSFCLEWLQGHKDALIYLCSNSLVFKHRHYPTMQWIIKHVDLMNIFYYILSAAEFGVCFVAAGVWTHLQKYAIKICFSFIFHFLHQSVFSCGTHHPGSFLKVHSFFLLLLFINAEHSALPFHPTQSSQEFLSLTVFPQRR